MNTLGIPGLTTLFSGNWNNGTIAGTFNWNLVNPASLFGRDLGTHLANFVEIKSPGIPWLSQKYIDPLMRKDVMRL